MFKKLVMFFIFILGVCLFGADLKILKEEYGAIEGEIERYKALSEYRLSEADFITLKQRLIQKNIEITNEMQNIIRAKTEIEEKLQSILITRNMLNESYREYENRVKLMEQQEGKVGAIEIEEGNYFIHNMRNEINKAKKDEEILHIKMEVYNEYQEKTFQETISQKEEFIKKSYALMIENSEKRIEILKMEKRSVKEIEEGEREKRVIILERDNELRDLKIKKLEKKSELSKLQGDLALLWENISINSKKLSLLKEKVNKGMASRNELFTKEMEQIKLQIENIDMQSKIKLIKLELDI